MDRVRAGRTRGQVADSAPALDCLTLPTNNPPRPHPPHPPDPAKFPGGISNLTSQLSAKGFRFGIYSAASSVVCSGRPGSLYNEALDAATFARWGVSYTKYDNCGEYALGLPRFNAFADAVNRTGTPMIISTEPFSIVPTPLHAGFAHLWRTGNDIDASYSTIIDRADLNAKWWSLTGPGKWADPDMLQCGHSSLTDAECRSHFGLWAIAKAPLILGSNINSLTPSLLAIVGNAAVIAVNQDPLGVQARKLAAGGQPSPHMVGLAPCAAAGGGAGAPAGINGVTPADLVWAVVPAGGAGSNTSTIVHNASGRCLGTRAYVRRTGPVPVLLPCDAADATQAWRLPAPGAVSGLLNVALGGAALTVGESTLYGAVHGSDPVPLPDAAYGITNLTFAPFAPEPPCTSRACDNYVPAQSWYHSHASGTLALASMASNIYRCFEGSCYVLTSHLPATVDSCLARVAAISNDGVDADVPGVHVWGGPLAGGAFVMALENRGSAPVNATGQWAWLEAPGLGPASAVCARELFTGAPLGVLVGGVTVEVGVHDIALLRLVPGATEC